MTPKEECEVLLDKILPAAENLLKKNGEFYPIGAVMNANDKITFTAVDDDKEYPLPEDMITKLCEVHKTQADNNEIKVSGIAWNAGVQDPDGRNQDAIVVSLEHRDNYSVIICEPYKKGFFKKVSFGNIFALEGRNDVWKK